MKLLALTVSVAAVIAVGTCEVAATGDAPLGPFNNGRARRDAVGAAVDQVFIVFSNHLDVGYTLNQNGSSAGAVVNEYFHKHFPTAIATAAALRAQGQYNYRWMAHSWLVDFYFHCDETKLNIVGPAAASDVVCPNASALAAVDAAIRRGDITYHAFPFNAEPEMYNEHFFDAGLNMTFRLDARFGHPRRRTLSLRDVPGLTRATVPLLARRGVRAVSVGENAQCAPVAVPPAFVWRDEASGTEVLALFHALGYGRRRHRHRRRAIGGGAARYRAMARLCNCTALLPGPCGCANDPSTLFYIDANGDTVMKAGADPHDDGPAMYVDHDGRVHASRWEHCVEIGHAAVCYAWKIDNSGPHSPAEATALFDTVADFFPGATLTASDSFDDFVEAAQPFLQQLPVVTAEIGDTWMMGANADPLKVALFRAASRAYATCMSAGGDAECVGVGSANAAALRTFERLMLAMGEHTWGWNGGDTRRNSWSNPELAARLVDRTSANDFWTSTLTWREQRAFIDNAIAALPLHSPLAEAFAAARAAITGYGTEPFDDAGFKPVEPTSVPCGRLKLAVDETGAVSFTASPGGNHPDGKFFRLWYHNLDQAYIKAYARDYVAGPSLVDPDLTAENLVKPNMRLPSLSANASLVSVLTSEADNAVLLNLQFPTAPHDDRGAPSHAQALLQCGVGGDVQYTLRWYNKTATHAPETLWLSNYPAAVTKVRLDKMGMSLDPTEADLGCDGVRHTCGVHLHGVGDGGVELQTANGEVARLVSLDNALVSVGTADPVPTPLRRPDITGGVHFALVGNIWNTNYPVWYPFVDGRDTSSQFRFSLALGPK